MKGLSEIVEVLFKAQYLSVEQNGSILQGIKFLQLGSIFLDNIRREWLHSKDKINTYVIPTNGSANNISRSIDANHILTSEKFREDFIHVKNTFQKELPLAIKEEVHFETDLVLGAPALSVNLNRGRLLTTNYFFNEKLADEHFYKIQRERKIWWMRFSPNPGRYHLTDLKSEVVNNRRMQSVKITSKFDFGDIELEKIHVIPLKLLELENVYQFAMKDTRIDKRVVPAVVRSEFCLEATAIGLLFDSVDGSKNRRISIHRKISPYQCSLFCFSEDDKFLPELGELATHLANLMRKSGIAVLNLPKCYLSNERGLQREILEMDKIGVPYSIILEPSSLKDGLMKLRSRDTAISEVIHITDVPDYLAKIVNS